VDDLKKHGVMEVLSIVNLIRFIKVLGSNYVIDEAIMVKIIKKQLFHLKILHCNQMNG